jgi:hypothetical protein
MATRMASLLDSDGVFGESEDGASGTDKRTRPLPIHAPASRRGSGASLTPEVERRREQVTLPEAPSPVRTLPMMKAVTRPRTGSKPRDNALPSLGFGIVLAAAIWVGVAVLLFGLVYPMSFLAHAVLVMVGAWITAAGVTYAFASRPRALV